MEPEERPSPPAAPAAATARCAHQIQVRSMSGAVEPAPVCSCPAGLVHMHDCPVENGLSCRFFRALAEEGVEPEAVLDDAAFEEVRGRLMMVYLDRPYRRRIRSLAPEPPPFERLCEERAAEYAERIAEPDPDDSFDEEAYVAERERLHEQRRKREEQRRKREEETRESRAKERARLGIKTAVERAREAVAQSGNVASSRVDEVELEKQGKKRSRRRRRKKRPDGDASAPPRPQDGGEGGAPGKSRRRRRRRRRGKPPPESSG